MTTLYQDAAVAATDLPAQSRPDAESAAPTSDTVNPREALDAHRDVQLAVQRALAANWEHDLPRIAVVERDGLDTVYVSTFGRLDPPVRADVHGAVRAALAPYAKLAPFTKVVFLTRGPR
jgi:hypothetical protein